MALRTGGSLDRAGIGRRLHPLLQEPGFQVACQLSGLVFDVIEGGEGFRLIVWKEAIEDGVDVSVQVAANAVATRRNLRRLEMRSGNCHG